MLPLRLLPKTSKNDVLSEGGSDGNEAGLGDNSSVRTLMWSEQATRVKMFWKLLEIKLGLCEGALGVVPMEAVRVLKQTGLKKVRPFVCPARRLVLPPKAGVRVTIQSSV